jgi:hypothetical protein
MKRRSLLLPVLLLGAWANAPAQTKWSVYTDPNKNFKVELPRPPVYRRFNLHAILDQDNDTPDPLPNGRLFKRSSVLDSYDLDLYQDESYTRFYISVFDVGIQRSDAEFDAETDAIMMTMAGRNKHFSKHESVSVNGLHARAYFYDKGKASGIALLVKGDKHIFFVHFYTEDKKGTNRGAVTRVFNTFQPVS